VVFVGMSAMASVVLRDEWMIPEIQGRRNESRGEMQETCKCQADEYDA
jgi:hypothetical protein